MDTTEIADQNTERLIQAAREPDPVLPDFAAKLEAMLTAQAKALAMPLATPAPDRRWGHAALLVGALAACILIALAIWSYPWQKPQDTPDLAKKSGDLAKPKDLVKAPIELDRPKAEVALAKWTDDVRAGMMPRKRPDAPALAILRDGQTLATKAGQRRLVQLADGTRAYINEKTEVEVSGDRQLTLHKGQIYLEVAPVEGARNFAVKAGSREMTATGTHFAVQSDPVAPGVVVTQGKVAVKGLDSEVVAGQQVAPASFKVTNAPRASHTLEWTRELMAAAETPMVPACQHAGGALIALDPQGQEIKLALRKYHIDVHIEDGFARTTIDQTYFNTTWERLEGTFYFPLPADASLSRLAMYVADANNQCKLMEGGMAERKHAADVYETIRYQRRDPALLEWLDGSTFKMRVFPLEAKQEKRIILSYVQKLPTLYGAMRYRFAGGHSLPVVREWSFSARVKNGAGLNVWSPTHEQMQIFPMQQDKFAQHFATNVKPAADVALELHDKNALYDKEEPRFSTIMHEGQQYLMLRYRPALTSLPERQRRDWIVLFEASAQRDPLLAGTQVDVLRNLLKNAEYDDTFTLLTVNSKVQTFSDKPQPARPKNVDAAIKFLNETHLIGALDLQQGLEAAVKLAKDLKNPHLVHIGSGIPAMGQRDAGQLAKLLPESVRYVGVGVGKRWNRAFMKAAAERTNGMFTQINPDEVIAWRAFDLLSTLNTPRLLDVQVVDAVGKTPFLMETSMLSQGEEVCAMTRIGTNQGGLPGKVIVKARISSPLPLYSGGEGPGVRGRERAFVKEFPVMNVAAGAGYLPRIWAKLEIDRLLADNAAKHKDEIIALSKAMYVMSPFTSLLVLETDADYEKYKVDKGRKDHWAMYDCPPKIPLVYEPEGKAAVKVEVKKEGAKPTCEEVLGTIVGSSSHRYGVEVVDPSNMVFSDLMLKVEDMRVGSLMLGRSDKDRWMVRASKSDGSLKMPPQGKDLVTVAQSMRVIEPRLEIARGGTGTLAEQQRIVNQLVAKMPEENERIRRPQRLFYELDDIAKSGKKIQEAAFDQFEAEINLKGLRESKRREPGLTNGTYLPDPFVNRTGAGLGGLISGLTPEKKPEAYVGQIIIVGDAVTKDRVVRRTLGNSSFPGTILKYEEFGGEIGFQGPQLLVRRLKNWHGQATGVPETFDGGGAQPFFGGYQPEGMKARIAQASFLYERPKFDYDRTLFTDLLQYAPGLANTQADILATLEAEADVDAPTLGSIDAGAQKLIDKARSSAWQALSVDADGPIPGFTIHYNGSGQFAYERILPSGLAEQVICDGVTLWHLYPEIGLAAKRPFSRYHQNLIASFHPSYLPTAKELARGYDLKAVDASTIALVPLWAGELKKDEKYPRVHLIFAADGRLSERRVVEMPAGKTLLRQLFAADGSIEWKDADDKSLAKVARKVAPSKAPGLEPKLADLVVMTMPIRTGEHIIATARKRGIALDAREVGIERFISNCLSGGPYHDKGLNLGEVFYAFKDHRIGFYTLINAAGPDVVKQLLADPNRKGWSVDIEKEHPNNPLATFLAQCRHEMIHNDPTAYKSVPGLKDGFIQRLSTFRNVWRSWHHQRPTMNGGADMPAELAKVIDFLEDTPSPAFAYAVLDAMQRRCARAPSDHMMDIAVKRFGPISHPLGLGYVFRYEQARSHWQAGKSAGAATLFKELHADTVKLGVLPPIDADFRKVLNMPAAADPKFVGFTRKTLDDLLAKKRFGLAFQLAHQMDQLGDEALRDDILTTILAGASKEERNGLTLVCVRYLAERKSFVQADRLLAKVLDDKKMAEHPELWRWREELARNFGQTAVSLASLEKALDLEYAELPELVNLQSIRADYRTLLNHYQKIAEANASLDKRAPKEFLAKVIRSADRWRLIDADNSEPCLLAGKIMHTLGERELAWDYWTTPIDLHPAESKPWLDLAETLKAEGNLERADKAFGLAFEAEPTNPEILWKRAQNQVRMGQPDTARRIYREIADGTWQERFTATVEQAKGLAER